MLGELRAVRNLGLAPLAVAAMTIGALGVGACSASGGSTATLTASEAAAGGRAGTSGASETSLPLSGLVRVPTPTIVLDPVQDIDGAPFSFAADPGHLQLLYFGYLSCPDVCPTTLADLKVATEELGDAADRVDVAMVTIDPTRDEPANLRSYLDHFLPHATGLRLVEDTELRAVADAFGATYGIELVNGEPQVSHSAFVYVLDDAGRLLQQWPFGTPAEDMTADLHLLLEAEETP